MNLIEQLGGYRKARDEFERDGAYSSQNYFYYRELGFLLLQYRRENNIFEIGDRFYFYRNMTDSETIKIGFKGVVDEIIELRNGRFLYCCDGYGFTSDEIKHVLKSNGGDVII